jgi:hypothetical protein
MDKFDAKLAEQLFQITLKTNSLNFIKMAGMPHDFI